MEKIVYISRVCSDKIFDRLMEQGKVLFQPAQKFHKLMIEGFAQNDMQVNCISSTPIPILNKRINNKFEEVIGNIKIHYSYSSKLKLLNRLLNFLFTLFKTIKVCKKNKSMIIADVLDVSISLGALLAGKIIGCDYTALITDLPEDLSNNMVYAKLCNYIIDHADQYIFLSEHMNEKINKTNKKYVVIEGIVDYQQKNEKLPEKIFSLESPKKICMYAGALEERYGVKMMIDSFAEINNKDWFLYLFGYGGLEPYIKEISKTNHHIVYFGLVNNKTVTQIEKKVDLLINPRLGNKQFTLYSFPSKNMEYLISATPVLCAKLGCIPDEYDDYFYYFDDENSEGFKEKLMSLLNEEKKNLIIKGKAASKWAHENKNNISQTNKILNMCKE